MAGESPQPPQPAVGDLWYSEALGESCKIVYANENTTSYRYATHDYVIQMTTSAFVQLHHFVGAQKSKP